MIPASTQKRVNRLVKITCSVERLKRIIVSSRGGDPDQRFYLNQAIHVDALPEDEAPMPEVKQAWELVDDKDVAQFVNFANVFLYPGNATIRVVEREPDPKVGIQVVH